MPDYKINIDPNDASKWYVQIKDEVSSNTQLFFEITDDASGSATVHFDCV